MIASTVIRVKRRPHEAVRDKLFITGTKTIDNCVGFDQSGENPLYIIMFLPLLG